MARVILSKAPDLAIVRVGGRLGGEALRRLREVCRQARRPVVVDLSHVIDVSGPGVELLRLLIHQGIHVVGVTTDMRRRLQLSEG